jgi:hypothetical protein
VLKYFHAESCCSRHILFIYIAIALYANVFFIKQLIRLSGPQLFLNQLDIFLILLVAVFLFVQKYVLAPYSRGALKTLRPVILTISLVGLTISILYHIIPLAPLHSLLSSINLPFGIDQIFASDIAFTIWLIVSLIALFI